MIFLSLLVIISFVGAGLAVSCRFFKDEGAAARLMLGVAFGLFLMMWLPALFAFLLSFNVLAQVLSVLCAILIICVIFVERKINIKKVKEFALDLLRDRHAILTVLPIFLLAALLLPTHVLRQSDGALYVGQSTYGDLNLHAGLITSVSEQKTFPPFYSLMAGETPVGYPFLCDTVSSTLYTLGADLRTSYILPMVFAIFGLVLAVFIFFRGWLNDGKNCIRASFATLLFFVGGGFGFVYFFDMSTGSGKMIDLMTGFYHTPMNFNENNIRWVNVIADMIIPQRATLFGWAILVPCLYLLVRAVFDEKRQYFYPLAVLAGGLPLIHTHSFLALGVISAGLLVYSLAMGNFKNARGLLLFGVGAVALAAPQLLVFTFRQSSAENFIRVHFNWVNDKDNYFWFYIKNLGLPYIVMIPAFLRTDTRKKVLFCAGTVILILAEFVVFQPNNYDNNKLIFIWYLLLCGLAADFFAEIYQILKMSKMRGTLYVTAAVVVLCNISGALTIAREYVSNYQLFSAEHVQAAEFIRQNTPANSLFLTKDNHNNTVAALTGRNIVCGAGTFLYYHGMDYDGLRETEYKMLQNPTMELLRKNRVNYVFISDFEKDIGADVSFFAENCTEIFRNNSVLIYSVD